jgi:hypothetical protein
LKLIKFLNIKALVGGNRSRGLLKPSTGNSSKPPSQDRMKGGSHMEIVEIKKPFEHVLLKRLFVTHCFYWSGRQDLNLRPPVPQKGNLLFYAVFFRSTDAAKYPITYRK